MMKIAFKFKLHYIIIPLLLAFLLYLFSLLFFFFPTMKNSVVERKKEMIQETTHAVWNIIEFYNKQVIEGNITLNEAQSIVKENVKEIRYGKQHKDYFWINDFHPIMIMHPYLPELENTDLSSYTDPDGTYLFNEMVKIAQDNGEGFVEYKWQLKDDTSQILPKISFIKAYEPWKWIIGTGVYVDDIEKEISRIKKKLLFVSLLITVIALFLYIYVIIKGYKNEKSLYEYEIKYRNVFESANDGVLIMEGDKFIDCNSKALKIFDCKKSEIIGKLVIDFSVQTQPNGEASYEKADKIIRKCLKGNPQFFEWKHKTYDGKPFIAEVSLSRMKIKDSTYLISFIRDITTRKRNEVKLIEAMEKAEASDKLKSAFLANMSHEVRTPMNGILGFSNLIQEENLEPQKRNEFLQIISKLGKHLMQIINDIIDISKIESNQITITKTEFSLNELLKELYTVFKMEKPDVDLRIALDLVEGEDFIFSDKTRLMQIITNLLTNAYKFTEEGFIELGYQVKDEYLFLYVKDTGIGIKDEFKEVIFDRFRQSDDSTSRKYGGTGLGLSISKGLVKLLGGEIGVESNGKDGSLFYFSIPYNHVGKAEKGKHSNIKNNNWEGRYILVVEDDFISFQYIKELMKSTNAELIHVTSGDDAIEFTKRKNIDLILMDIQLPGIDGNDTTREIRKFDAEIPIIAQTANAMADDKEKSLQAGCNDYISKPIDAKDLIDMIGKYIA